MARKNYHRISKWFCFSCDSEFEMSLLGLAVLQSDYVLKGLPKPDARCRLCGSMEVERRPQKKDQPYSHNCGGKITGCKSIEKER